MKTSNLIEAVVSFGAAVVVIGAYFKIVHLPYADIMLAVGLITEASIFMLYGFQYLVGKVPHSVSHEKEHSVSQSSSPQNLDGLTKSIDSLHSTIKTIYNR